MANTRTSQTSGLLEERVDVETPEQVVFSYTIAGVGSRALAAMMDYLIIVAVIIAFYVLFLLVAGTAVAFRANFDGFRDWAVAIVIFFVYGMFWLYYVLFEGLNDGQTPGKYFLGLRVVQDGGFSVSFAASAVRNLVRAVDLIPGIYGIGAISTILSKSGKRLGDYAAGTIVVQERSSHAPFSAHEAPLPGSAPVTSQLTDEEYAFLERYLTRRDSLLPEKRAVFDSQVFVRFGRRLQSGTNIAASMLALYGEEKALRARGVSARSDTGAAREQHAIVAAGAARWKEFAAALESVKKRKLRKMPEEDVADFVARYREVSTDLARLRTATRGRDSDSAFYLSRLVAAGHNLFYRQRQLIPLIVWDYLAVEVPREIRRSAGPILLAALLLYGPGVVSHIAVVRNPSSALNLIGPGMVERAETAVARERRGGAYLPSDPDETGGAAMTSSLATNNILVAYQAFALGITAGIGTMLILFFNGVMLGAALGIFQHHHALHMILAFVFPHGVLELTAICIAGGGGLLFGSAFLLPGRLTRREALVVRGRRSMRLLAGATLLLSVAALIEGNISPKGLKLEHSIMIGAATGVLMILYFMAGRGDRTVKFEEEFGYSDDRPLSSR